MHYYVHVMLPGFYVQELPESDRPHAIVHQKHVLDADAKALASGVEIGMPVKTARALAEGLQTMPWIEDLTRERSERWWTALLDFADGVQTDLGHRATLDLSSHPEPTRLLPEIRRRVSESSQLTPTIGVGDRPYLAVLCADHGVTADNWKCTPVELIHQWPSDWHERMRALGCATVGDLAQLPEAVVRLQFGKEWRQVYDLVRRRWSDQHQPNFPSDSLNGVWRFSGGTEDRAVLHAGLKSLARHLGERLIARQQQGEKLRVILELESGPVSFERVFAKPIRNPLGFASALLRLIPEEVREPIDSVRVSLLKLERVSAPQWDLEGQLGRDWRERSAQQVVRELRQTYGEQILNQGPAQSTPRRQKVLRSWEHALGL